MRFHKNYIANGLVFVEVLQEVLLYLIW